MDMHALADARWTDRDEAHEATATAMDAIEALQATDTWFDLPHEARQAISRAHGVMAALHNGLDY